jgi:hypothetical protein
MNNLETKEILITILQMLRDEAVYLHRQHGWMIAVADAVRESPEAKKALERHPFYDQGPRPDEKITENAIRNIDALIQKLIDGQ